MFEALTDVAPERVIKSFRAVHAGLAEPGQTLTSAQRIQVAQIARDVAPRPLWEQAPDLFSFEHSSDHSEDDQLSPFVAALAERVAVESRSLDRTAAARVIDVVGDATYAEVVALVSQVVPIDHFMQAINIAVEPLPKPGPGKPTNDRPDGLGDIGAFIAMTDPYEGANVARSLSLAGPDNWLRLGVVRSMYSGSNFDEMVWTDRALSRPEIELVAARTSALNECFY